ncbi:hypothetical protein NFHSH190041_27860 [Shewanella sp. NFH-SH190041]|uniref:hypothetical protein n=1 Tax=Shewanella sp. NFH-SH190041 TaxID=2950245 RepID=UPI0021C29A2A|nr:hypothetical protein [Shewanella sp. NFH-SH190041]BDM65334.1 hypothetical protein NFHSH190041_27860 [Shewanella sp. NFH-SH190041]
MSQIDQIVSVARFLQLAGKTPTIALLKSQLKEMPMPLLIQGIQKFKSLSAAELAQISPSAAHNEATSPAANQPSSELDELKQQLHRLQQAYDELAKRVAKLEH